MVVVADPDYEQGTQIAKVSSRGDRSAGVDTIQCCQLLEGTRKEARAIQEILPDAQLLMSTAATKTAVQKLQSPQILLLETHGFFLPN